VIVEKSYLIFTYKYREISDLKTAQHAQDREKETNSWSAGLDFSTNQSREFHCAGNNQACVSLSYKFYDTSV